MEGGLRADRDSFFPDFVSMFFSVDGTLKATSVQVDEAVALCLHLTRVTRWHAWRRSPLPTSAPDLPKVTVSALVIHRDGDGVVPFEGSGKRTHEAIAGSELVLLRGAPHGNNVTHADEFNSALVDFLTR